MKTLRERLKEYETTQGHPIRVGLVGSGQMGTGLIGQMELMDGMKAIAVTDVIPGRSYDAFLEADVPAGLVQKAADAAQAEKIIAAGKRAALESTDELLKISALDIIVESTGIPEVGAQVCSRAIEAGKHVVNMNVEADATIGYYLGQKAQEAGVVYTLAAGDEPGAIKEIYDFADALGFDIVAVGKGKNNLLNRASNPENVAEKAHQKQMSPKMLASFEDGTKTMVEMTSIANAIGFAPEVRGAHGPKVTVQDLPKVFCPQEAGGILSSTKVVDYAIGPAPGVFVIITTDREKIIRDLNYLGLNGHNGYWCLYRPYHLANLETPISIANAVLNGLSTLVCLRPPTAETIAVAKKDLKTGEKIDALGGFTVYGMIEKASVAKEEGLLPLGLAVGAILKRDVPQGSVLTYDDLELDKAQRIYQLRQQQDQMLAEA
jgi:predicted homoserine dehydrogenase-like protein